MKRESSIAYSDILKLDQLQNACLEVGKGGQALILAYAQGYAAAKKESKSEPKKTKKDVTVPSPPLER